MISKHNYYYYYYRRELLLKSKAFFMSSVSKEDQYNQIHGIKEKLSIPPVGRYKPKYELVDKKQSMFVYRNEPTTVIPNHKKANSVK